MVISAQRRGKGKKGGRAQTWPAMEGGLQMHKNKSIHVFFLLLLTYDIQRCVLPLSLSLFLSLPLFGRGVFYGARWHARLTAQASVNTGSCWLMLHRAPIITINAQEENLLLFVAGGGKKKQGCQLETVQIDASPPRLFPTPFLPLFFLIPPPPLSHPSYSPSSSKTTCTFFLLLSFPKYPFFSSSSSPVLTVTIF